MSRIGNQPIALPAKVEVSIAGGEVTVKGPLGTLSRRIADGVTVEKDGETIVCKATRPEARAIHGTTRALIANMVRGVSQGFERKLSLVGVGYRAQAQGDKVNLQLGFSHPVVHMLPKGVTATTPVMTISVCVGVATLMPLGIWCTTGWEKPSESDSLSPCAWAR